MIAGFTGHRSKYLGGYTPAADEKLLKFVRTIDFERLEMKMVLIGMALGFDQAVALVCIELGIPFIAVLPCVDQDRLWPKSARDKYHEILNKAFDIVIVNEGVYQPYFMQIRNEWIVDNCDYLFALWNGSSGGTANCIKYAINIHRPYINLWHNYELVKNIS